MCTEVDDHPLLPRGLKVDGAAQLGGEALVGLPGADGFAALQVEEDALPVEGVDQGKYPSIRRCKCTKNLGFPSA